MKTHATAAIFTAQIWPGRYKLPLMILPREQIEHEILNSRDLSKKGSAPRRFAYAMRTASKAIALTAQ